MTAANDNKPDGKRQIIEAALARIAAVLASPEARKLLTDCNANLRRIDFHVVTDQERPHA